MHAIALAPVSSNSNAGRCSSEHVAKHRAQYLVSRILAIQTALRMQKRTKLEHCGRFRLSRTRVRRYRSSSFNEKNAHKNRLYVGPHRNVRRMSALRYLCEGLEWVVGQPSNWIAYAAEIGCDAVSPSPAVPKNYRTVIRNRRVAKT